MTTLTSAVAQHLNIVESTIKEIQEWAKVLLVKFTSGRSRFVSKKVKPTEVKKEIKPVNQYDVCILPMGADHQNRVETYYTYDEALDAVKSWAADLYYLKGIFPKAKSVGIIDYAAGDFTNRVTIED
jgi:hypothetical protein